MSVRRPRPSRQSQRSMNYSLEPKAHRISLEIRDVLASAPLFKTRQLNRSPLAILEDEVNLACVKRTK
jgi:hypothetical protein